MLFKTDKLTQQSTEEREASAREPASEIDRKHSVNSSIKMSLFYFANIPQRTHTKLILKYKFLMLEIKLV